MKGLFQCPPRATPWVLRRCPLAPCKGKSLEYMLLYNQFYLDLQDECLLGVKILYEAFALTIIFALGKIKR